MGIVIRQSIKATVVSYIGFVLGYINVVLLFPLFFKPEEFGLTRILIAVTAIVVQFAQLGTANVIVQFFPQFAEDKKKSGGFFYFSLLINIAGFLISALILIIFKNNILSMYREQSPLFIEYYYYVLPIAFLILISAVIETFSKANYRIAVPIFLRDVLSRILVGIIIFAFYFRLIDFNGFIILFTCIYIVPIILKLIYLNRLRLLHFSFDLKFLERNVLKKMASVGIFSMLVGSTSLLVGSLDVLMLSSFLGLASTGIYSVGFYIGSVIEIPTRSISQISIPVVVDAFKKNEHGRIEEMYKKTSLNQIIFGSLLFIGIWANVDNLLKILPPVYQGAKWVIFFVALSKLVDMSTGINTEIIMASKHYRFNFYVMLILITLTIVTNFIFIPVYGLSGAAFAAALSVAIFNLIKLIFIRMKFKMQPFTQKTFYALIIPACVFFISALIPSQKNFVVDIIIRSSVIVILFSSLILGLKVSEDINRTFGHVVNRVKSILFK